MNNISNVININKYKLIITTIIFVAIYTYMAFTVEARINIVYDGETHTYTEEPFSFYVNGDLLTDLPVEPVRINNRFYVPARAFFEKIGAEVSWYDISQQVLIVLDGNITLMGIDQTQYYVNDQVFEVAKGEEPKLVGYPDSGFATTMVPVRMVSEGLGFVVTYDGENKIISIDAKDTDETDNTEDNDDIDQETDNTEDNDDVDNETDNTEDNDDVEDETDNTEDNDDIEDETDNTEDNDDIEQETDNTEDNDDVEETDNTEDNDDVEETDNTEDNDDVEETDNTEDNDDVEEETDNTEDNDDVEEETDNTEDNDDIEDNGDYTTDETFILPENKSEQPLTEGFFDTTTLNEIEYIEPTFENNYSEKIIIRADSEISKVTELLLPDGRLVLDFDKMIFNVQNPKIQPNEEAPFTYTNGSQFANEPSKVSRFVIYLKSGTYYTLKLSEDRKELEVEFITGEITDYSFEGNNFIINGTKSFNANTYVQNEPFSFIVDLPGMVFTDEALLQNYDISNLNFVNNLTLEQYTPHTARFTFNLTDDFVYSVEEKVNGLEINFGDAQSVPVYYSYMNSMLVLNKSFMFNPININEVSHRDNYFDKEYSFTFDTMLFNLDEPLQSKVNSEVYNYFNVQNNNDNTSTLKVNLNQVKTFLLEEDDMYIYFIPKKPSEVYDKLVVVDPGHGGKDPGTTYGNFYEKDIVLDVGLQVEQFINESGENIKVYMTRNTDVYVELYDITEFTNEVDPDVFLSIHVNSASPNTTAGGTETYYYNDASPEYAEIIQQHLLQGTGLYDRKVKTAAFVVIREVDMPAVLTEMAFISNPDERALLQDANFRTSVARSLANGIIESMIYFKD